jgi:uncharacterized protein
MERRYLKSGASVRLAERGGNRYITGLSAVFFDGREGTQYQLWDDHVERIRPGAFDRALAEADDVRGLYNHDASQLLGRTANGTLRLWTDRRGLLYEIQVDEHDPDHERVVAKIERGDLSGSSFAFKATSVAWEDVGDGRTVRWIESLRLYDVGPVTYPAYESTSVGLRSDSQMEELRRERDLWLQCQREWRERRLKLEKLKGDMWKA